MTNTSNKRERTGKLYCGEKRARLSKKKYADDNIEHVMDSKRDYCKRKRYEIKANCKEQIERECDVDVVVRR